MTIKPKMTFKKIITNENDDAETIAAKHELWRMGDLSWKLKGVQVKIYESNIDQSTEMTVSLASRRLGKCLAEGTLIPTTNGLKKIEDIKIGDYVYGYGSNNKIKPTRVVRLFNQGMKEVVDLIHNKFVYATCTKDHRFLVHSDYKNEISVKKISELSSRHKIRREFVPFNVGTISEPHAYAIGAILGDGCSKQKGYLLYISGADEEVVKKVHDVIGAKSYKKSHPNNYTWSISNIPNNLKKENGKKAIDDDTVSFNYYKEWCKDRYAHEKIINLEIVKTWDRESCLNLLAGLIDTDGSIILNNKCLLIQFCSQSKTMIECVQFLLLQLFSVQVNIRMEKRDKYKNGPLYSLSLKNNLHCKRVIRGLDNYLQVPRKKWKPEYEFALENNTNEKFLGVYQENPRLMQCYDIEVDNETHLYLLANGLITHNSTVNLVTALEVLIQHPLAIVKYACPTQKMVKETIVPILRMLMADAPPEFSFDSCWSSENKLMLPNGSFLAVAGTDNKNVENLRGAYAHLIFADEAGFMDDLGYAIDSVLLPQLDSTNGRLIMTSTPNFFNPQHEFHTRYVFPQEAAGKLNKYTVWDSPIVTHDEVNNKIIPRYASSGGINSPQFRCEYLVEIPKSSEASVVPEFYSSRKEIIVDDMELPGFVDTYVSGDIGVRDLTVFLFGYYDFLTATLYIMDEWVMNGMDMTTTVVADSIKAKEEIRFTSREGFYRAPLKRVMDNNLNMIIDLNKLHGLNFTATKKDNKAAAVNNLRILVQEGRLKIHSRCKHLIYHTENAIWKEGNGTGKEFQHLPDSIDGEIRGGHADACFVPGTRVLTKNGYKKIEDITPGEQVLTHKGRFKTVKHNLSKEYSGELFNVKIRGKFNNIKGTVDHRYFVTNFKHPFIRKSNNTPAGGLLPTTSEFSPLSLDMTNKRLFEPYIHNNENYNLSNEMCFLYGYWVAEGHISQNKSQVKFAGHQKETNVFDIIKKAIDEHYPATKGTSAESIRRHKLGLNKPMTSTLKLVNDKDTLGRSLVIGKKQLWQDLQYLGKSDFKKFPDFISKLNHEQSLYMVAGYLYGDGSFSRIVKWSTISPFIAGGMEILMKKIGYNPSDCAPKKASQAMFKGKMRNTKVSYNYYLTSHQGIRLLNEILSKKDLAYIFEQKSQKLTPCKEDTTYSDEYISVSKIEKEWYNGKVYNLEVEEDESYCVEGVAVHNCDALIYMVRNLSLHHNPYPSHINNVTENQQQRITYKEEDTSTSFIKKLLGRKR